jgi:2-amino-4-hydroxy-6-hydroxymethyldihydropteridine diphosphokinase
MKNIFLSLGSNIDAQKSIDEALKELKQQFGEIKKSPIYESEAVGFEGDNFLNMVVELSCELELVALVRLLKAMEDKLGRERAGPKFSSRLIDIDVIFYGDACGEFSGIALPRYEVYENAYVLLPMVKLAPDFVDPKTGKSMQDLWQESKGDMEQQKLWEFKS